MFCYCFRPCNWQMLWSRSWSHWREGCLWCIVSKAWGRWIVCRSTPSRPSSHSSDVIWRPWKRWLLNLDRSDRSYLHLDRLCHMSDHGSVMCLLSYFGSFVFCLILNHFCHISSWIVFLSHLGSKLFYPGYHLGPADLILDLILNCLYYTSWSYHGWICCIISSYLCYV